MQLMKTKERMETAKDVQGRRSRSPKTLVDNGNINLKAERTPKAVLEAIQTTIKEEEHC